MYIENFIRFDCVRESTLVDDRSSKALQIFIYQSGRIGPLRSLELWSAQERDYLPFPAFRGSSANTFRTSDWESPNCLAMREGAIPALKVASTAFI